jgi:hypothetical protein
LPLALAGNWFVCAELSEILAQKSSEHAGAHGHYL